MDDQHQPDTQIKDSNKATPKKSYSVSKILLIGTAVGVVASAGCCVAAYPTLKKKYDTAKSKVESNPGPKFY